MEGGEARIVAYTKVFAIRARLDKRVRYITDGEKTSLASSITYISNPEKTEQFFFTSALNCSSVDTALSEMMETKQQFGKMGGVLGYHFIQSFQPGEVTPEQAHAIGLEFAKRLFGKRYEVVISTHLNKHHLHNHLVVNSVSCVDGQKYHSSPESYYNDVRGTSDELCRENDLSVIAPQGKGKHYAEWKAEQGGKPTVRGVIRADIDAIIHQAYTYDTFLMLLRKNGYEVRRSPNRKYTTVKPPGAKRAIRLDSLGEGYTEADILLRLSKQRHGGIAPPTVTQPVKRYRMKGKLSTVRKKKITGFHALYFVLAKLGITYGMDLLVNIFDVCNGIVATAAGSIGGLTGASVALPQEIADAIGDVGFLASIPLWLVTLLGSLFITVLAFIMILTVYGRFFKIYMYAALSPVALASFAGEGTSHFGKAFLRSYVGVCMEGAVIVLACIIFSAFSSSGTPVVDSSASVVTQVWSYLGEVIFNLLVLVGLVKSADHIAKEMLGL